MRKKSYETKPEKPIIEERIVVRSEKEIILDEVEKSGYPYVMEQNVPMFHIANRKDYENICQIIQNRFSFGVRYAKEFDLLSALCYEE